MKKTIMAVTIAAALFATSFANAQTVAKQKANAKTDQKAVKTDTTAKAHPHIVRKTTKIDKETNAQKQQAK